MIYGNAHVKINDRLFVNACESAAMKGMTRAASILQREYKTRLSRGNRLGTSPSFPGEPPKRGTGAGIRAIQIQPDFPRKRINIVVRPEGRHLLYLGAGTRPFVIRARGDKLLKIWWRPTPYRTPTKQEIDRIGLKKISGRWYYFRRTVRHPGVKQRPWIMPGFFATRRRMIQALRSARP